MNMDKTNTDGWKLLKTIENKWKQLEKDENC